ncbi:MAG TPA: hypothetical protein VGM90_04650 [Kofleriaceae bacterium]
MPWFIGIRRGENGCDETGVVREFIVVQFACRNFIASLGAEQLVRIRRPTRFTLVLVSQRDAAIDLGDPLLRGRANARVFPTGE